MRFPSSFRPLQCLYLQNWCTTMTEAGTPPTDGKDLEALEEKCKSLIVQLDAELKELAALIARSKAHIRIDALYTIPLRDVGTVDPNKEIEVTRPEGSEAVDLVIHALTHILLAPGQDPKSTFRTPGAVGLPTLVLEQIQATNQLRMQLFENIKAAPRLMRTRIWKSLDFLSSLQAMRVTPVLAEPKLIRFYWDTGSVTTRWVARDLMQDWEDQLKKLRGQVPTPDEVVDGSVEKTLLFSLEQMRAKLKNFDERVAIHRPGTPHVRARITDPTVVDAKTGEIKPYLGMAAVPFVYDIALDPPKISALSSYSPSESKRAAKEDVFEPEPLVDRMKVYRYVASRREYGPFEKKSSARNVRASNPLPGKSVEPKQ